MFFTPNPTIYRQSHTNWTFKVNINNKKSNQLLPFPCFIYLLEINIEDVPCGLLNYSAGKVKVDPSRIPISHGSCGEFVKDEKCEAIGYINHVRHPMELSRLWYNYIMEERGLDKCYVCCRPGTKNTNNIFVFVFAYIGVFFSCQRFL